MSISLEEIMGINFGDRLRICRIQMGMNQSDLARSVGLQAAAVSKYEKNQSSPNVETLTAICKVLSVSADWLLGLPRDNGEPDPLVSRVMGLPDSVKDRLNGYLDALGLSD